MFAVLDLAQAAFGLLFGVGLAVLVYPVRTY